MEVGSVSGNWVMKKILTNNPGRGKGHSTFLWSRIIDPMMTGQTENIVMKMCSFPEAGLTERQRNSWREYATIMSKINHPDMVKILPIPQDLAVHLAPYNLSGLPVLCMEYCSMGDLRGMLNNPENSHGLSEYQVRVVLSDMRRAIGYLHSLKIIHGDLKPEGVVLHPIGYEQEGDFHCKLVDVGRTSETDSLQRLSKGSTHYSAPELFCGKTYTRAADYWSFGLIAFEVLCGTRPFLPNMAPAQWMLHVKTKSHQHIAVFENIDGGIEYSDEIFNENRITRVLKGLLEKWLRAALEWDPARRGCLDAEEVSTSPEDDDRFLKNLSDILSKRILSVYSVPTYEFLSYEVERSTTVKTLQMWVERDTKVSVDEQMFLDSATHAKIDMDGLLFADSWDSKMDGALLYLHQRNGSVGENIQLKVPEKIRKYMQRLKTELSYNHLVRAHIDIYDFLVKQSSLCDYLFGAFVLRLEAIESEIKTLKDNYKDSEKHFSDLGEKFTLFNEIIALDKANVANSKLKKDADAYLKNITEWLNDVKPTEDNILKLKEAWGLLTTRLESVSRRCISMQYTEAELRQKNFDLYDLHVAAAKLIKRVRRVPKEDRNSPKMCVEGAQLLIKGFKIRDSLLSDVDNRKFMQKVVDLDNETQKMGTLIVSAGKNANILSQSISDLIMAKQVATWKIFEDMSMKSTATENKADEAGRSLTDFRIGHPVRSLASFTDLENMNVELVSLINDSKNLCMISEDFISRSYKDHKAVQEELLSNINSLNIDN